jgi:YfiH family protein
VGNYAAFNINNYCGDEAAHIAENRRALAGLLGIDDSHIVMPHQVHGTEVRRVDAPQQEVIEGVDAVMTDVPGLCIGVSTADCIPIIIYDPQHHAACAVHAGWRGTVKRIAEVAVRAMCDTYASVPSQMRAVIGPGISLESFEVGDEVFQQFADAGFEMSRIARKYAKWHIDLPLCNRLQLEGVGVTDVQLSGICTYQQCNDYFSARRLGINSGRIFTGVLLR